MDLFNHLDLLPIEVQNVLEKYSTLDETYENCENLVLDLQTVGYTCEFGLDAVPFNLEKIVA